MLARKFVLENMELVKLACICKNYYQSFPYFWDDIETWDRWLKLEQDTLQNWVAARKNTTDRKVLKMIAEEIKWSKKEIKKLETKIDDYLKALPNIPADDVPVTEKLTFGDFKAKLSTVEQAWELFYGKKAIL